MSVILRVVNPGALATLQDAGRFGYQRFGVPQSGPMDRFTHAIANALVENDPGEAAIEFTLLGGTYAVEGGAARVVVAGAFPVTVNGASRPPYRAIDLRPGEQLRIGAATSGARGYLAVAGGFDVPPVLGSRSTHVRSGIGGLDGRALARNAAIPLRRQTVPVRAPLALDPRLARHDPGAIRVIAGPQDDYFDDQGMNVFLGSEYRMSPQSDRMGMRLEGPAVPHKAGFNIVSDGIAPGSVQVPGNGLPIVLLADRQSTGGYPKIATVISADLSRLGQLRPGETLRFARIGTAEAEALAIELRDRLDMLRGALRPAGLGR